MTFIENRATKLEYNCTLGILPVYILFLDHKIKFKEAGYTKHLWYFPRPC